MLGLYTPVFLLQAFCVYHAYKNNIEQRWYWLILFFPLVGCIIYLVHNFNNVSSLTAISENVKQVVISNYKIEQLEKALRFSESLKNKVNLADEYVKVARYKDAVVLYTSCLQGFMEDDPVLKMKLLRAHFMDSDYTAAVALGKTLQAEKAFKDSEERVLLAWSFYHTGDSTVAVRMFEEMNKSFTNYYHRKEYSKFLITTEKTEKAKEILSELIQEYDHIKGPERRLNRDSFREIRDMYESLMRAAK
jgi:hypothetical protein